MKIGLFGGSFNPIHVGHIALARQLRQLAALDEVWLMVSPQNPLKQGRDDMLDDRLRFEMAKQALEAGKDKPEDDPDSTKGLVACDYELHLPKPSYTWNTLQHLHEDYPDREFVLLIGADNWQLFHRWYRADDIIKNYEIIVYPRRGSEPDQSALPPNVHIVETALLDISSTMVREHVRQGRSIAGMVPTAIEEMVLNNYRQA